MSSMYFTEEHNSFRKSFKDFLQKEVVPHINKWEKEGAVERFIWKKFGEMGYFGLNQPEEYGGLNLGLNYLHQIIRKHIQGSAKEWGQWLGD